MIAHVMSIQTNKLPCMCVYVMDKNYSILFDTKKKKVTLIAVFWAWIILEIRWYNEDEYGL